MKILSLFLVLFFPLMGAVDIIDQNSLTIKTPSLQERKVAKFQLSNGLKVVVISDPTLDKSGAALAVGSGSLSEPTNTPGLAHFLEHMLFMGTEKYPDENLYWDFITSNGGQTNAFTDNDRTVYMFSISNDSFLQALDQFSQFFITPLFNPSGVSREMHAVDQEYRRYTISDDWRALGLIQALGSPDSLMSRFTVGSLDTLQSVTQSELKTWWKEHYSARIMTLLIYSALPVDVVKQAVLKDFSDVPSGEVTPPKVTYSLQPAYEGKKISMQSIQDGRALYVTFDIDASYYQQARLLEQALSDESAKSLTQFLRSKGFADGISSVMNKAGERLIFIIKISLTEQGEVHSDEVLQDLFGTLNHFKQDGIPQTYFDQWQEGTKLCYSYQSPQDLFKTVMKQGGDLLDEDLSTFPMNTVLLADYNSQKTEEMLSSMNAAHSYIIILSPNHISGSTEKWFGASYTVEPFPEGFLESLDKMMLSQIALPESNPYFPENLELVQCEGMDKPEKICDEEGIKLYFLCDQQFHVPKSTAILHIKPAEEWSLGTKAAVVRDFIAAATSYKLQPELFLAGQAGLDVKFEEKEGAFLLRITGFNESLAPCLETIAKTFKNLSLSPLEFATIKSLLLQNYLGALSAEPFQQGLSLVKEVMAKSVVSYQKKAKYLDKLTKSSFEKSSEKLLKGLALDALLFGNTTREEAKDLCQMLKTALETMVLDHVYTPAFFQEMKGPILYKKEMPQLGNFAGLIIQDGCFSLAKEAALNVLTRGLTEPFFSELRSKQQTGYIVKNICPNYLGSLTELFFVQSTTYDADELLFRFELFLDQFQMDETHFEALRTSYIEELKAPEKSPLEMADKLDKMAFQLNGDFSFYDKRIKAAEALSYASFKEFYQKFLARSNKQRIALLLKGKQQGERALRYTTVPTISALHNTGHFILFDQNKCH